MRTLLLLLCLVSSAMAGNDSFYQWNGQGEKVARIEVFMDTKKGDPTGKKYPALRAIAADGKELGYALVSPGKNGSTPEGNFKVLGKSHNKKSSYGSTAVDGTFINARMPHSLQIDHNGDYIHGGPVKPGEFLSKGCVRVPFAFAEKLFAATDVGTPVHINLR